MRRSPKVSNAQTLGLPNYKELRRCLTLPHPDECSTISAGRLSFRVRNGTGRFPTAITTAKTRDTTPHNRRGAVYQASPTTTPQGDGQGPQLSSMDANTQCNNCRRV